MFIGFIELEVATMTKEDYREKVEEHRQEIDLHSEPDMKMSRTSRHSKKNEKKQKNPIMKILVVVFIFIPLSILFYVLFLFEPSTTTDGKVATADNDQLVQIEKQDRSEAKAADKEDEEKETEENNVDEEKEKEKAAADEAEKAEEQKAKEAEEQQKIAAQKAKELEEKKKAEEEAQEKASAEQKTHTVTSSDNLYRIALKYYGNGSPANIEKIKKANNLTSDSIAAGQVLIITP